MGRIPHKLEWGGIFFAIAYVGTLLGSSVIAFAESTSPPPANASASQLSGEQAIAFHSGYVQAFPEPISGMVIGARDAKRLYSQGDALYLRLAPTTDAKVGDQFTLFRPTTHMYHPVTRDYMGQLVVILGVLEIARMSSNDVTEAQIVRSFDSMAPGDLLKPYKAPPPVPAQQVTSGPLTGMVLDFKTPRQLTGQSEIVYVDKGEMDGLALGDRLSVSRPGQRISTTSKNPDETIAQLKIISMQARTATASVVHSSAAVQRGDVINRLPPPPPKAEPAAAPPKSAAADAIAVAKAAPAPAKPAMPEKSALKAFADVYFDSGKSKLTAQAKKTLTEHADYLKENPTLAITIEGYADERGSAQSGLTIGEKRAQEVRKFLAGLGVKNALRVTSFGQDRPVCMEKTATCHAKNRRVHLAAGN